MIVNDLTMLEIWKTGLPAMVLKYHIVLTHPCNLEPPFYIVKLGFSGVNIIFSYFLLKTKIMSTQ